MAKDPAFLFYSKDFIEGTSGMKKEVIGIFALLICYQHQRSSIPGDVNEIARLVGMTDEEENASQKFLQSWDTLKGKYKPHPSGGLHNERLTEVITERSENASKNALIGVYGKLIRECGLPHKRIQQIKKQFHLVDFFTGNLEADTIRLTEWFDRTVNRSAIANEDAIAIENGDENTGIGGAGEKDGESEKVKSGIAYGVNFNPPPPLLIDPEYVRKELLNSGQWHEKIARLNKTSVSSVIASLNYFFGLNIDTSEGWKKWEDLNDARSHFNNWYRTPKNQINEPLSKEQRGEKVRALLKSKP